VPTIVDPSVAAASQGRNDPGGGNCRDRRRRDGV